MKLLTISFFMYSAAMIACNDGPSKKEAAVTGSTSEKPTGETKETEGIAGRHFTGSFSNGMKGNNISFDISKDGKKLVDLLFQGYWHCNGKLESITGGPEGSFAIEANTVSSHISEPPNGGSTAWRFDMTAAINGKSAKGTFRMNINNLGCNTGTLNFTATAK